MASVRLCVCIPVAVAVGVCSSFMLRARSGGALVQLPRAHRIGFDFRTQQNGEKKCEFGSVMANGSLLDIKKVV